MVFPVFLYEQKHMISNFEQMINTKHTSLRAKGEAIQTNPGSPRRLAAARDGGEIFCM